MPLIKTTRTARVALWALRGALDAVRLAGSDWGCRVPRDSVFPMEPGAENRDRAPVAVEGWMADPLIVERHAQVFGDMRVVGAFWVVATPGGT